MEINGSVQEKTFSIEGLSAPEGIETLEKLLPEWEKTSGDELQYGYRADVGGKSWRLSFDPKLKRVSFSEEHPTLKSPRIGMRNVERIQVDEQRGSIDFVHKSGIIYRITSQGLNHMIISSDGEVTSSFAL